MLGMFQSETTKSTGWDFRILKAAAPSSASATFSKTALLEQVPDDFPHGSEAVDDEDLDSLVHVHRFLP